MLTPSLIVHDAQNSERVAMFVRLQLAMVLAIASTLSKESGFTVLGLFVVFELCVASRLKPSLRLWYVAAFVRIVITIAVAMAFLWLRRIITGTCIDSTTTTRSPKPSVH